MADTDDVNDPTPLSPRVTAQADRSISPRRDALRRIAAASRSLIEDLVGTDVPPEELVEMAEALEGLAEMAMSGGEEPLEYFFDHSPLVGLANPLAPPIVIEVLDDMVVGRVTFGSVYEGPPGCVHGGFVAAAFDEVLGSAQTFSGAPGMTGRLTIHYRRPTPLHAPLLIEGRFDRIEGRKVFTTGRIIADGQVTAEAEGLFISIDATKFRELADGFDRRVAGPDDDA